MFGSIILEVSISLVFVYILLSLVCTAFNEWVARILALRSKTLEAGIKNLLSDPEMKDKAKALYEHPLIKSLYKQGRMDRILGREGGPSYIPPQQFAIALMDILFKDPNTGRRGTVTEINKIINNMQNEHLKKSCRAIMDNAEDKLDKFQEGLETWFNESMNRVTGWYSRHMGVITLCFALVVTLGVNADTVHMAREFAQDNALRAAVVDAAGEWVAETNKPEATIKEIKEQAEELNLPLGWSDETLPAGFDGWLVKIVGLAITTLALSLGAPFWFDVLSKLVNMRRTGQLPKPDEESLPEVELTISP